MLDDLIQGDFVLDKESDLDVQLINVLLCKLVLPDVLDDGFA